MTLDDKDRKLLAALAANARESVVSLARRIGLSRSATQERLARLERSGAIRGYSVRLAEGASGAAGVRAWMSLAFDPGVACDAVIPFIEAMAEVEAAHALAGPIDLLLSVRCASNGELSHLRDRIAAVPGVASVTTHILLATRFERGAG
ncbi:MAG TPA: Lrp/AsnC family transcriptional regulator [Caulobacteraceae bacterium]|nr:Lrp/AsnC family transcriptional regulator [Caulobacteraceae bacterium]